MDIEGHDALLARKDKLLTYLGFDRNNLALQTELLVLMLQLQDWDEAEKVVVEALSLFPNDPTLKAHAGYYYVVKCDFEKSAELLSSAIDSGIRADPVLYNLSHSLYHLGDYDKANKWLSESSQELTREAVILKARLFFHVGELRQAKKVLEPLAAALDPEAMGLLALLHYDDEHSEEALAAAEKVLAVSEYNLEAMLARGSVNLERENYDLANADFLKLVDKYPTVGRAWSGLGQIQMANFELDSAVVSLESAVATMPNHVGTWNALGWVQLMLGRPEDAKVSFETALALDHNFGETHGALASVYSVLGDKKSSNKHKRLAEHLDPDALSNIYSEFVELWRDGKNDEAKKLIDRFNATPNIKLGIVPGDAVNKRIAELEARNKAKRH